MFDLKEPVEVTVNGKLLFKGTVAPDARAALEEARRFNDRKLVFANRITIEVDGEPRIEEPAAEEDD